MFLHYIYMYLAMKYDHELTYWILVGSGRRRWVGRSSWRVIAQPGMQCGFPQPGNIFAKLWEIYYPPWDTFLFSRCNCPFSDSAIFFYLCYFNGRLQIQRCGRFLLLLLFFVFQLGKGKILKHGKSMKNQSLSFLKLGCPELHIKSVFRPSVTA